MFSFIPYLSVFSFSFWQIPILSILAILIHSRRNVDQFDYLAFLSAVRGHSPTGNNEMVVPRLYTHFSATHQK